jgi:hypothetical protein
MHYGLKVFCPYFKAGLLIKELNVWHYFVPTTYNQLHVLFSFILYLIII